MEKGENITPSTCRESELTSPNERAGQAVFGVMYSQPLGK